MLVAVSYFPMRRRKRVRELGVSASKYDWLFSILPCVGVGISKKGNSNERGLWAARKSYGGDNETDQYLHSSDCITRYNRRFPMAGLWLGSNHQRSFSWSRHGREWRR